MTPPADPADAAVIGSNHRLDTPCLKRLRPQTRERLRPRKPWSDRTPLSKVDPPQISIVSQRRKCISANGRAMPDRTARRGSDMLAQQFHEAVTAARSRAGLDEVGRLAWRALAEGHLNEIDAEAISTAVEARRASMRCMTPEKHARPSTIPTGGLARSHCRSPDRERSIRRRRSWVASGWLPPSIAAQFTPAEAAALAVVAEEVRRNGRCEFPLDRIAAVAGVSRSSVRNALRSARLLGLVTVTERRHQGARSETNVIGIVSAEWLGWLRLGEKRWGGWSQNREHHESKYLLRNESRITKGKTGNASTRHLVPRPDRGTRCCVEADRRPKPRDRQLPRH